MNPANAIPVNVAGSATVPQIMKPSWLALGPRHLLAADLGAAVFEKFWHRQTGPVFDAGHLNNSRLALSSGDRFAVGSAHHVSSADA